jgi:hypothetical protein
VARAKRTARADARRRYRADHAPGIEFDEADTGAPPVQEPTRSRAAAQPAPQGRVGIGTAFRLAFRPLDLRGDLRALPWIATRTKAIWVPLLITVGSTIAFAVTQGQDIATRFLFAYFVQTPAIGGVFIAGFLAPRASWLAGLIVGLVAAICYTALILTVFGAVSAATATQAAARDAIVAAFALSPTLGAMFAAAAAWYRRFLQYTNPNRGRQAAQPKRGDGRSRGRGAQKAGVRR